MYFNQTKSVTNQVAMLLLIPAVLLLSTNCSKELPENPKIDDEKIEVDRLSFASEGDFKMAFENFAGAETKSSSACGLNASLLSKSSRIDVEGDPVLSYDFRNVTRTKADNDASIYELGGYDELVPDENLAAFLNARAEIEVGSYIYKISPRGTYYFAPSKEDEFNRNYSVFEESEGNYVDSMTVQLSDGIFRLATFENAVTEEIMSDNYYEEEEESASCAAETKAPTQISSLQNLDWSKYPRYQKVTNFFTNIFGHSYGWFFTNKRKFTGNFFTYNYGFYASIGCEARMYRKSFIFWGKENAEELYVGWSDIITTIDLEGNATSYANHFKNKGLTVTTTTEKDSYSGSNQTVAYVLGFYLTQAQIDQAIGKGIKSLLTTLKSKCKTDISTADKILLAGPDKIYTIYRKDGHRERNTSCCKYVFYQSAYVGVSVDLLNLPQGWQDWLATAVKSIKSTPKKPTLKSGEIHAAVKFNGDIGAMTVYN